MAGFDVDPDALREAASTVDAIASSSASTAEPAAPEVGHDGLTAAIATFGTSTTASWTARLGATSSVASNLRRSASTYEGADVQGAADLATRRAMPA